MSDIEPSEAARLSILTATLPIAAFEGWTDKTLRGAVAQTDLPEGAEALYFPGGPVELISFWAARCDRIAEAEIADLDLTALKIRERVTAGVLARLKAIGGHEDAARRGIAKLSLPSAGTAGPKALWSAADMIWRAIGDTSTDANFYSKRTVLSGVISTSLIAWINDSSPDKTEAKAFLDSRIENVMQFEKFKSKLRGAGASLPDPVKILSGLRYGRRRRRR